MVSNPKISFKTHSNYIRAFATLVGLESQSFPDTIYRALTQKVLLSGCLPTHQKADVDESLVHSSLSNAWGTELLIDMGREFINEPELVKLSNNWSIVQTYYILYHSTQCVAIAKGHPRPDSHSKTKNMFHDFWASRNLYLEPWTLSYSFEGAQNIPSTISIDDNIDYWTPCSSSTAWSLACKALRTTRNNNLPDSINNARVKKNSDRKRIFKEQEAIRTQQGKKPRKTPKFPRPNLTPEEMLLINMREPPTTIIDYFHRLRSRTNYTDTGMFTEGPENEYESIQLRNDFITIAGGTLLLAELTVKNIIGQDIFLGWIKNWVSANVPTHINSGIRDRLKIHSY